MLTSILNFGPRHPREHQHNREDRIYLIWPTYAWRVAAPEVTIRRVNPFQRATLGLCRAGVRSAEEISNLLHLQPKLIEAIGAELAGSNWVNPQNWAPTEAGLAVLKEEEEAIRAMMTGWVFQNPWRLDLWPYFGRQLELQEASPSSSEEPVKLMLGSDVRPRSARAFRLSAPTMERPQQPSAQSILDALCRHNRRERLRRHLRVVENPEEDPLETDHGAAALNRITWLGETPEMAGLVTYAYPHKEGPSGWFVCDPFGFGVSDDLRVRLEKLATESGSDAGRVVDQIERKVKDAFGDDYGMQLELRQQMAETEVCRSLTIEVKRYDDIFKELVNQKLALDREKLIPTGRPGQKAVIQSARRTLEAVLGIIADRFPFGHHPWLLTNRNAEDWETINHIARKLGFATPVPNNFLPDKTRAYGFQRYVSDASKKLFRLNGVVINMLLRANQSDEHPFSKAAKLDAAFLKKLESLIEWGNRASHAGNRDVLEADFSIEELELVCGNCLWITAVLLELPYDPSKEMNYGEEEKS